MKNFITFINEEFENEQTGEKVEGITILVDGALKQVLDIIKKENQSYNNNLSVLQDAMLKGLEQIKQEIDNSRNETFD